MHICASDTRIDVSPPQGWYHPVESAWPVCRQDGSRTGGALSGIMFTLPEFREFSSKIQDLWASDFLLVTRAEPCNREVGEWRSVGLSPLPLAHKRGGQSNVCWQWNSFFLQSAVTDQPSAFIGGENGDIITFSALNDHSYSFFRSLISADSFLTIF